jgi:Xaa-Pro aminopeptidase
MFQSYAAPPRDSSCQARLAHLRALLRKSGIDALLVPRADEHQGEYVPAAAERLAWVTGFTGSAGLAVVARTAAALFVDGRYRVQARQQVDGAFEILEMPTARPEDWLGRHLTAGAVVGADARLHSASTVEALAAALKGRGITLKLLARNPVDRLWGKARPAPPQGGVVRHPLRYAGKPAAEKIGELQALLRADQQDAVVLTMSDSIAWLFNIRGADVQHNPVVLAFAIVPARGKPEIFIAAAKLGAEVRGYLAELARISDPSALEARLKLLKGSARRIRLDPATASSWFFRKLAGGKALIARAADPCALPKACKNPTEIKGARAAHRRDGAVMVRFLHWLDREAVHGGVDEIAAAMRLEELRRETQLLKEISFDTIAGAGPHGAIVHYRVTAASNRRLRPGELFLIDSGGQYLDGTTDVTRAIAVGEPTQEMRQRFTLVLKGHIGLATARFPKGTRGVDVDAFARRALWQAGLDFDHGTGHGVGSYLSVHEGPQSISRRSLTALQPGMIVSNEPGYYREGAYGIRIENLLLVSEAERPAGGERDMLGFETLTLAPIDRRLVDAAMLTREELEWLNAYHRRVATVLSADLAPEDGNWLMAATAPIVP